MYSWMRQDAEQVNEGVGLVKPSCEPVDMPVNGHSPMELPTSSAIASWLTTVPPFRWK